MTAAERNEDEQTRAHCHKTALLSYFVILVYASTKCTHTHTLAERWVGARGLRQVTAYQQRKPNEERALLLPTRFQHDAYQSRERERESVCVESNNMRERESGARKSANSAATAAKGLRLRLCWCLVSERGKPKCQVVLPLSCSLALCLCRHSSGVFSTLAGFTCRRH